MNQDQRYSIEETALHREDKAIWKAEKAIEEAEDAERDEDNEGKLMKKDDKKKVGKGKAVEDDTPKKEEKTEALKKTKKRRSIRFRRAGQKTWKAGVKAEVVKKPLSEKKKALEKPVNEKKKRVMKDMSCFYIANAEKKDGHTFVLEAKSEDKYKPRKTGVYNIDLRIWNKEKGSDSDAKAQQWYYKYDRREIGSKLHEGKAVFAGFNDNLVLYDNKRYKN